MQEMPGSSIDNASGAAAVEQDFETPIHDPEQTIQAPSMLSKLWTAKTGSGSIESYIDHPMNFDGSKGMAQMIRGATGLIGSLDLALIDIGMGLMRVFKPKKMEVINNNVNQL